MLKNKQTYPDFTQLKNAVLLIALSIGLLPIATAQDEMQRLGQVVGAYIGGGYMLAALKSSECGYAYKATPNGGQARFNEVLSALKSNPRDIVSRELPPSELKKIEIDAAEFVRNQITAIKKDYDNKTGCGIVSGMIVSVTQKYDKSWHDYLKSGSVLVK